MILLYNLLFAIFHPIKFKNAIINYLLKNSEPIDPKIPYPDILDFIGIKNEKI
jgi:hypothetical protein